MLFPSSPPFPPPLCACLLCITALLSLLLCDNQAANQTANTASIVCLIPQRAPLDARLTRGPRSIPPLLPAANRTLHLLTPQMRAGEKVALDFGTAQGLLRALPVMDVEVVQVWERWGVGMVEGPLVGRGAWGQGPCRGGPCRLVGQWGSGQGGGQGGGWAACCMGGRGA
jgi:hypothetical protein